MLQFAAVTRLQRILLAVPLAVGFTLGANADSLDGYPLLRESFDPGLQAAVTTTIKNLGLRPAVRRHQLAIALVDISDPY